MCCRGENFLSFYRPLTVVVSVMLVLGCVWTAAGWMPSTTYGWHGPPIMVFSWLLFVGLFGLLCAAMPTKVRVSILSMLHTVNSTIIGIVWGILVFLVVAFWNFEVEPARRTDIPLGTWLMLLVPGCLVVFCGCAFSISGMKWARLQRSMQHQQQQQTPSSPVSSGVEAQLGWSSERVTAAMVVVSGCFAVGVGLLAGAHYMQAWIDHETPSAAEVAANRDWMLRKDEFHRLYSYDFSLIRGECFSADNSSWALQLNHGTDYDSDMDSQSLWRAPAGFVPVYANFSMANTGVPVNVTCRLHAQPSIPESIITLPILLARRADSSGWTYNQVLKSYTVKIDATTEGWVVSRGEESDIGVLPPSFAPEQWETWRGSGGGWDTDTAPVALELVLHLGSAHDPAIFKLKKCYEFYGSSIRHCQLRSARSTVGWAYDESSVAAYRGIGWFLVVSTLLFSAWCLYRRHQLRLFDSDMLHQGFQMLPT